MKEQRIIVWAMERLGIATAYGNRTQATDWLGRTAPASCGFVAYNPFMPARIGWENYTIYVGGEDDMAKARILEGELTKWFKVRYEQYPRYSGNHVFMNVSVRAKAHHIGMFGGGGQQEPDALNFTMPNGGTIALTKSGSPTAVTLEYTIDGGATWTEWTESGTTRTLTLNAGEKVYIRNTSTSSTGFGTTTNDYYSFSFSSNTYADGNCDSLLCKNPNNAVITPYCYRFLFSETTTLVTAPKLPSTELADNCYYAMFYKCEGLKKAADLPAKTLKSYCYASMYNRCYALVNPPTMVAETAAEHCCDSMFYYDTHLAKSPVLHIGTLAESSYAYMFGRSGIAEIRTYMTDITASQCLTGWMNLVPSGGDFYCPASLTIPAGVNGIPGNWTRHDI